MPIYIDNRVKYQRQELKCCYNCPHVIDEGIIFRCELAHRQEGEEKEFMCVEPTSICELYPGINLKD